MESVLLKSLLVSVHYSMNKEKNMSMHLSTDITINEHLLDQILLYVIRWLTDLGKCKECADELTQKSDY